MGSMRNRMEYRLEPHTFTALTPLMVCNRSLKFTSANSLKSMISLVALCKVTL